MPRQSTRSTGRGAQQRLDLLSCRRNLLGAQADGHGAEQPDGIGATSGGVATARDRHNNTLNKNTFIRAMRILLNTSLSRLTLLSASNRHNTVRVSAGDFACAPMQRKLVFIPLRIVQLYSNNLA